MDNMSDMGFNRGRHSKSSARFATGKDFRAGSAGKVRRRSTSAARSRSRSPGGMMDDTTSAFSRSTKKHHVNSKITKINNAILVKGRYSPRHLVRENVHTEHA